MGDEAINCKCPQDYYGLITHSQDCEWFKLGERLANQFRENLEKRMMTVEDRLKDAIKADLVQKGNDVNKP